MTKLSIIEHHGENVVDSRLIAEELGIEHKSFLSTIRKYEGLLLKRGRVAFEKAPLQTAGGMQLSTFCYLNERQSIFLMTLSKNTEKVVACKDALEEAFSNAKQSIASQSDRIRELELELELRKAEQKLLDTRNTIVLTCPEPVQQKILGYQVVEKVEYRDRIIHDEEIIRDGQTVNKTELCHRYGYINKAGGPDYRKLNKVLGKVAVPSEAWKLTASIRENQELNIQYLAELDRQILQIDRQLNLGE